MTNQKRVRKTHEQRRADVHGAARSIALESGLSAQSAVWAGYEDETARYVVETVAALLRIPAGDAPRTASY